MKAGILLIMVLWWGDGFAQAPGFEIRNSGVVVVSLLNSATDTVYCLFPTVRDEWYLSTTAPTRYRAGGLMVRWQAYWLSGDCDLFVQTDSDTGSTDSLAHWIKPLVWDEGDKEYVIIDTDSTFIKLGAADSYTAATVQYLDWDSGEEYHTLLTGELWPVAGFVIVVRQAASDVAETNITYQISGSRTNQ